MAAISIIIPTRLRKKVFVQTIEAATKAIEKIDAEIIVINDCAEDEVLFNHPKVKIYNNTGRGVSKARNSGALLATAPILLFIDNDILITEENVLRTIKVHASKQRLIVNANWIYPPSITSIIDTYQFGRVLKLWKLDSFKDRYSNFNGIWQDSLFKAKLPFSGFYFSINRNDFLNFTMFNENIVFGGEEENISQKIIDNDIEYWVDPQNIVLHNEYDKVTNYKDWLKRIELNSNEKVVTAKQKMKRIILNATFFITPVNQFILDHFPNRPFMDKNYAKLLYLQSLYLRNRVK